MVGGCGVGVDVNVQNYCILTRQKQTRLVAGHQGTPRAPDKIPNMPVPAPLAAPQSLDVLAAPLDAAPAPTLLAPTNDGSVTAEDLALAGPPLNPWDFPPLLAPAASRTSAALPNVADVFRGSVDVCFDRRRRDVPAPTEWPDVPCA